MVSASTERDTGAGCDQEPPKTVRWCLQVNFEFTTKLWNTTYDGPDLEWKVPSPEGKPDLVQFFTVGSQFSILTCGVLVRTTRRGDTNSTMD